MASKKLLLTIPEKIHGRLEKRQERLAYPSMQRLIVDMLRDELLKKNK